MGVINYPTIPDEVLRRQHHTMKNMKILEFKRTFSQTSGTSSLQRWRKKKHSSQVENLNTIRRYNFQQWLLLLSLKPLNLLFVVGLLQLLLVVWFIPWIWQRYVIGFDFGSFVFFRRGLIFWFFTKQFYSNLATYNITLPSTNDNVHVGENATLWSIEPWEKSTRIQHHPLEDGKEGWN